MGNYRGSLEKLNIIAAEESRSESTAAWFQCDCCGRLFFKIAHIDLFCVGISQVIGI